MKKAKHIFEQRWLPAVNKASGIVSLVGEDGTPVVVLARPDHGSDMLVAGYIVALQSAKVQANAIARKARRKGGRR